MASGGAFLQLSSDGDDLSATFEMLGGRVCGALETEHENGRAHDALETVFPDRLGYVEQPVLVRDFGRLIDEETGIKCWSGHTRATPSGNSATSDNSVSSLTGTLQDSRPEKLTEINMPDTHRAGDPASATIPVVARDGSFPEGSRPSFPELNRECRVRLRKLLRME